MLEASTVIGQANFDLMKSFLSRLIGTWDIDTGGTRVGIVTYSSTVGSGFNLGDHLSVSLLQSAIMSLSFSGGSTNTVAALEHVRNMMLTAKAGARVDVPKVVVMLSAGPSDDVQATQVYCNRSSKNSVHMILITLIHEQSNVFKN